MVNRPVPASLPRVISLNGFQGTSCAPAAAGTVPRSAAARTKARDRCTSGSADERAGRRGSRPAVSCKGKDGAGLVREGKRRGERELGRTLPFKKPTGAQKATWGPVGAGSLTQTPPPSTFRGLRPK